MATKPDPLPSRRATDRPKEYDRAMDVLVIAIVAAACVVLIGAGLGIAL